MYSVLARFSFAITSMMPAAVMLRLLYCLTMVCAIVISFSSFRWVYKHYIHPHAYGQQYLSERQLAIDPRHPRAGHHLKVFLLCLLLRQFCQAANADHQFNDDAGRVTVEGKQILANAVNGTLYADVHQVAVVRVVAGTLNSAVNDAINFQRFGVCFLAGCVGALAFNGVQQFSQQRFYVAQAGVSFPLCLVPVVEVSGDVTFYSLLHIVVHRIVKGVDVFADQRVRCGVDDQAGQQVGILELAAGLLVGHPACRIADGQIQRGENFVSGGKIFDS
ncbi:hypothetical protein [Klebsiella phage vB_KpnS-MUC-5]|nr:hypothetical protein [Klebsiella phage vB_KpnS-MUC-5]